MRYPHLPSCDECQKWVYDIDKGELITNANDEPVARKPGQALPCRACPKESPDNAKWTELSCRNMKTLQLYLQNRALFGRALSDAEASDRVLQFNFAVIDGIMRRWELQQASSGLEETFATVLRTVVRV